MDKNYFFAGLTRQEILPDLINPNQKILCQEMRYEQKMKYVGEGEYVSKETGCTTKAYVFKLLNPITDDYDYKGCSGTPIMDEDGNIVALLLGRQSSEYELYGAQVCNNLVKLELDILTKKI